MNRPLLVVAALLALGAAACQKAAVAPAAGGLVGEWDWVQSQGGLMGNQTYTPASTGTTRRWVFRADSTFQVTETRQGVAQPAQLGSYSLGAARNIYSGQSARALTIRLGQQPQTYVLNELSGRLVLADNFYDGYTTTYERR